MPSQTCEITIDVSLLKQTFPHLSDFGNRLQQDIFACSRLAPFDITIPQEFLYHNIPLENISVAVPTRDYFPEKIDCDHKIFIRPKAWLVEIVSQIVQGFLKIGYNYIDIYYFYRERLNVRSLYELVDEDLVNIRDSMSVKSLLV
jgi:hypothetical protein